MRTSCQKYVLKYAGYRTTFKAAYVSHKISNRNTKMHAMISFLLRLCLLLTMALASTAQNDVISSKKLTIKGVKGNFMYHYSQGSACSSLVILVVGTGMSVGDYNKLATSIAQNSPDTVVFNVDNNPHSTIKTSSKKFASIQRNCRSAY